MDRDVVAGAVAGHLGGPVELEGTGDQFAVRSEQGLLHARVADQAHGWRCGETWRLVLLGSPGHDAPAPDWLAVHADGRWWPLDTEDGFRAFVEALYDDLSGEALAGILAATHSPMASSRLIVDAEDLSRTADEFAGLVEPPVEVTRSSLNGRWQVTFLSAALIPDVEGLHRLWIWRWHVTGEPGGRELAWWALPVIEGELLARYAP